MMSDLPVLSLERVFDAPRELVWRAWTDPELLARWYGPGVETVIHGFDLATEGAWKNEMRIGDNSDYQMMVFKEVTPPERLVWHHFSTDADWNVISNPMMPDWPRVLLTTVELQAQDGKTNLRFSQVPHESSQAEIACFESMIDGMSGGWGKGFEVMDEILAELG